MGKKAKVLLLVHPRLKPDRRSQNATTENSIDQALKRLGHKVDVATAEDDLKSLDRMLVTFQPAIVFNLMEEFRGEGVFDFHLASYLEARGVPYTGCNPRGLALSRNKFLVMKAAQGLGVGVPGSALGVEKGVQKCPKGIEFPLFVKLNREHASLGITAKNRVRTDRQLQAVCRRLRRDYHGRILIQQFVSGDDVTVSLWGNRKIEVFSPWRLRLPSADDFATEHLKFTPSYRRKHSITAEKYSGDFGKELRFNAEKVFSTLDLSGYARMDFRITREGQAYLVDVNANPSLSETEDFADSARAEGYSYFEVIQNVVRLGLEYQPQV